VHYKSLKEIFLQYNVSVLFTTLNQWSSQCLIVPGQSTRRVRVQKFSTLSTLIILKTALQCLIRDSLTMLSSQLKEHYLVNSQWYQWVPVDIVDQLAGLD